MSQKFNVGDVVQLTETGVKSIVVSIDAGGEYPVELFGRDCVAPEELTLVRHSNFKEYTPSCLGCGETTSNLYHLDDACLCAGCIELQLAA